MAGFGPFGKVLENPAEQAVRAMDGLRIHGHTVFSQVMPVSHRVAHAETLKLIEAHRPALVLGLGVAVDRERLTVERQAHRRVSGRPDVNGEVLALPRGPRVLKVGLEAKLLAEHLEATVSEDAGDYVCNGWLYRVLRGAPGVQVGFLHVPSTGVTRSRLRTGLSRYLVSS